MTESERDWEKVFQELVLVAKASGITVHDHTDKSYHAWELGKSDPPTFGYDGRPNSYSLCILGRNPVVHMAGRFQSAEEKVSTLAHELGHAVQQTNGWHLALQGQLFKENPLRTLWDWPSKTWVLAMEKNAWEIGHQLFRVIQAPVPTIYEAKAAAMYHGYTDLYQTTEADPDVNRYLERFQRQEWGSRQSANLPRGYETPQRLGDGSNHSQQLLAVRDQLTAALKEAFHQQTYPRRLLSLSDQLETFRADKAALEQAGQHRSSEYANTCRAIQAKENEYAMVSDKYKISDPKAVYARSDAAIRQVVPQLAAVNRELSLLQQQQRSQISPDR